jgi:hypothetical protein
MKKRFLSLSLALIMILTLVPATVTAEPEVTVLMSLTQPERIAAGAGAFDADGGVFASVSNLSAWDNNTQINIGAATRAPVVIENGSLAHSPHGDWKSAGHRGIDVNTATAFQIMFRTAGYDKITFTAKQRSTGSGPNTFALAYSIGSPTGPYTPIPGSVTSNIQAPSTFRSDTYADFGWSGSAVFTDFPLPEEVNNQETVYLRVYFNGLDTLGRNGNTSINDIIIHSGKDSKPVIPFVPEEERLVFSHQGGVYPSQFNLTLQTGYADGVIWYTTDGSEPVPNGANSYSVIADGVNHGSYTANSIQYASPILIQNRTGEPNSISMIGNESFLFGDPERNQEWGGLGYYRAPQQNIFKGNVIKARVFLDDGTALTPTATNSYIIQNNISATFSGLPIISVSTDAHGLFDFGTGLFTNSDERGGDWERPSHMEFFETTGANTWERAFAQNLGLRIHGGWSRMNPQKSMRFYASSSRDPNHPRVAHDIFDGNALTYDGEPIVEFRRFILRNFGQDDQYALMRDRLAHTLMNGTNVIQQGSRPAIVMLNGEFWGLYGIRERIDEHFLNSKYNLGSTNVAYFSWEWDLLDQEDYPDQADYNLLLEARNWFFNPANNMTLQATYEKAQTFVDIESLIDYFIIQIHTDNRDWPQNNFNMWRYQTAGYPEPGTPLHPKDGRWRYIMRDLDISLAQYENASLNRNRINSLVNGTREGEFPDDSHWHALYFRRFCENAEFAEKFINRYFDLLNTHLSPAVTAATVSRLAAEISAAVPHQHTRWGQGWWWSNTGHWSSETAKISTYLNNRPGHVTSHMVSEPKFRALVPWLASAQPRTLTLSTDAMKGHFCLDGMELRPGETPGVSPLGSWSGNYLSGMTKTIAAVSQPGYQFSRFIVNGSASAENPLSFTISSDTTVEVIFCDCDYDPCDCPLPDGPPDPRNRGVGFAYMFSASPAAANWSGGFNQDNSPYVEFDVTKDGTHTLTLPPWRRDDSMWINTSTKALFLSPSNPSAAALPVTVSIAINGEEKVSNQPTANGNFWNNNTGILFGSIPLNGSSTYGSGALPIPGYTVREYAVPGIPSTVTIDSSSSAGISDILGPINQGDIVTVTYTVGTGIAAGVENPSVIWPEGLTATDGQTLGDIALPAHTGDTPGVFSWTAGGDTPVGDVGEHRYNLTFTPENVWFRTVRRNITVTVGEDISETIAAFNYTPSTANVILSSYPATGGVLKNGAGLEFYYADGVRANLGRTQGDREPVNVPNHSTSRFSPASGEINANNSAGWIISLDTKNFEDLVFTAEQGSSNNGPRDFRLAYRIGTAGQFTEICAPGTHTPILSGADTIGRTFNKVKLPEDMENHPNVQLKVYISSEASRGTGAFQPNGGNTSMNNILITGTRAESDGLEINWPAGLTATVGQTLGDIVLPPNTGGSPGNFIWAPGTASVGTPGLQVHHVIFVPTDILGNSLYALSVYGSVTITVEVKKDSPVIINQVYGAGPPMDGSISHSFIELYNTSGQDIDLGGWSVQIANATGNNQPTGNFSILPLTGKAIKANSYFLIAFTQFVNDGTASGNTLRYTLPHKHWDMEWHTELSNRAYTVALVNNQTQFAQPVISESEWAGVLSIVSAYNDLRETILNRTGSPQENFHPRISKQNAIRRVNFGETGNNFADFEVLDYRATGISNQRLEEVKPRWSNWNTLFGDINGDGVINSGDVTMLKYYIASSNRNTFRAENPTFNFDAARVTWGAEPTAADVSLLQLWIATPVPDRHLVKLGPQ